MAPVFGLLENVIYTETALASNSKHMNYVNRLVINVPQMGADVSLSLNAVNLIFMEDVSWELMANAS